MSAKPRRPTAAKRPRWQACNLLHIGLEGPVLWEFNTAAQAAAPTATIRPEPGKPLHARGMRRGWGTLFNDRLNLALLPAEQVFLRVVHLPKADPGEVKSMLELQLEKLSPLPVNQIVWAHETLPADHQEELTVICAIADRAHVESFLQRVEKDGFTADRLDVAQVHPLIQNRPSQDGTWLYLSFDQGHVQCLSAWWHAGRLEQLDQCRLPEGEQGPARLVEHITRLAWAGEVEGWLVGQPQCHLVCPPEPAPAWESALRGAFGECTVEPNPPLVQTAQLIARRAARGESSLNLLPAEFTTRYRQLFIDRLWMQGLAALLMIYLAGVIVYAGAVKYHQLQRDRVQREVALLAPGYTNALTLRERLRLFQEQAALKYAALNCMRAVSELLPENLTLEAFHFQGGEKLFISGTAGQADADKVLQFNADLRKARIDDELLFDEKEFEAPKFTGNRWDFTAKLKTSWLE